MYCVWSAYSNAGYAPKDHNDSIKLIHSKNGNQQTPVLTQSETGLPVFDDRDTKLATF